MYKTFPNCPEVISGTFYSPYNEWWHSRNQVGTPQFFTSKGYKQTLHTLLAEVSTDEIGWKSSKVGTCLHYRDEELRIQYYIRNMDEIIRQLFQTYYNMEDTNTSTMNNNNRDENRTTENRNDNHRDDENENIKNINDYHYNIRLLAVREKINWLSLSFLSSDSQDSSHSLFNGNSEDNYAGQVGSASMTGAGDGIIRVIQKANSFIHRFPLGLKAFLNDLHYFFFLIMEKTVWAWKEFQTEITRVKRQQGTTTTDHSLDELDGLDEEEEEVDDGPKITYFLRIFQKYA